MKRGLFLVQLPPPIHGVSVMNERVVGDQVLRRHVEVDVLRIAYTRELAQINRVSIVKFGHWLRLMFALWRALSKDRHDFVYFTPVPTGRGYVRDLPFLLLVKRYRVPLILHLHGRGISEQAMSHSWRALYRLGLNRSAIVSASPGMSARELAPLDLTDGRLYIVPNTVDRIDTARFVSVRVRPCIPRLLFLSSTFPFKGIFVLLESLRRLVDQGVAFEAEIVGTSTAEHDRRIEQLIATYGLSSRVQFLGGLYGEDKYCALGRADVFVHPTLNDYFPLVILEAMQFGLAIVSTPVGAIPEMVIDGVHGVLVPPGDEDALARAIEDLVSAPDRMRRMGAAAQCRYQTRYSPEQFSAALIDVLEAEGLV